MSAIVKITKGDGGKAGWFRCDKHGIPRVTTRQHAERFVDARGATGAVELLKSMGWESHAIEV